MLSISKTASVSSLSDITPSERGSNIYIGDHVFIDSLVRIKAVGGEGDIVIGDNCFINSGTVMFSGNGIVLGEWVLVAPNCTFVPVNHSFDSPEIPMRFQGFTDSRGGIIVEDNVWIGAGTTLLDGSILRSGCVVGAGSLVKGELRSNCVYAGNPIRLIKNRFSESTD